MRKKKARAVGLTPKLLLAVILFGVLLCAVISFIGYFQFRRVFVQQYGSVTGQFAYVAVSYVDGNLLDEYLAGGDVPWKETWLRLMELTNTADLDFIRVTVPDVESGASQRYVFDTPNTQLSERYGVHEPGTEGPVNVPGRSSLLNIRRLMLSGQAYTEFSYGGDRGGLVVTAVPVRNSANATVAMLSVGKSLLEMRRTRGRYLRSVWIAALLCAMAFSSAYGAFLVFQVGRPIQLITSEMTYFAEHEGALSGALRKIKSRDELELLARALEKMGGRMNKYITELTRMTAERERISVELDVASQIQSGMLPKGYPPFPNRTDFDLFGAMYPAKEVGGDLYDYQLLDGDHLMMVVGDVSGKGVPASLFMVVAKTLLSSHAAEGLSPAEIFERTNSQLCDNNDADLFVTCWLGIITLSTGTLVFANAGHPPPVFYHAGAFSFLRTKPNLVLAGLPGMKYANHTVRLEHGDRLLIYTDGVTEATDVKRRLFGEEQLLDIMRQTENLNPNEAAAWLKISIDAFADQEPQFDDITLLNFTYK